MTFLICNPVPLVLRTCFFALLLLIALPVQAQRQVALTFDDLPYAGPPNGLPHAAATTDALLATLDAYDAPASLFVTGTHTEVEGETDARLDLLRRWRDGGHRLENHGYSHLAFSKTDAQAYLNDVARGHALVTRLLDEGAGQPQRTVGFYRPPFNDLGEGAEPRAALGALLEEQGVRLAPFTAEHADYLFNRVYADALSRGDTATAARIGEAYLAQLDTAFAFAERLTEDTFGRAIPQVFLLHANILNAHYLGAMLARLQARGYTFVTLEAAMADQAYQTPDAYTRKWGVSWLHRWRAGLGLENRLRDEPEPPGWVVEAYEAGTD